MYPALQEVPLDSIFLTCGSITDSIGNTVVENHGRLKRSTSVSIYLDFIYLLPLPASGDERGE